jgi:hypothetical protein
VTQTPKPAPDASALAAADRAERARRVKEMLTRWKTEPLGEEPDWEPTEIPRLALHSATSTTK